jgi:competence protein ComEA
MRRACFGSTVAIIVWALMAHAGHAQMGGTQARTPAAPKAQASVQSPVNLNTATATDLEKLPGIGPAVAARIVEFRQKNGGFKKIEDLMNVRGIGEKTFLKLKPLVTVTPKSDVR